MPNEKIEKLREYIEEAEAAIAEEERIQQEQRERVFEAAREAGWQEPDPGEDQEEVDIFSTQSDGPNAGDIFDPTYEIEEKRDDEEAKPIVSNQPSEGPDWNTDVVAAWTALQEPTYNEMMNDPLVKHLAEMDRVAQMASDNIQTRQAENVVEFSADGKLLPPKKSLLTGATSDEQTEFMKAIKKQYEQ